MLKTFRDRGELRVPDPDVAGEQFFHMLKDEYHQRLLLNLKPKVTRATRLHYARACAQTFLRAFSPPTEGQ